MREPDRGVPVVSLPAMREAGIGCCLATVLARSRPHTLRERTPPRKALDYACQAAAYGVARGQLAYYHCLMQQGELEMITTGPGLARHWARWADAWDAGSERGVAATSNLPVGFILSMEGADPIVTPDHARHWWDLGLRTVCLAHYGQSAYAMGTGGDGPLTEAGRAMLPILDELGMIVDLVHTADTALDQILDGFGGLVFVSHGNARSLRRGDRQISDDQIRHIAERGGVIGVVLDAWMLDETFRIGQPERSVATLHTLADHIDHIAQTAGSIDHVAIGSDLDGGFDAKQCPRDLNAIGDLHQLEAILADRGYTAEQIDSVLHDNWLRFFTKALPEG